MSYILDALKRSEQEEKIRQTPALDTVHVFSPKSKTSHAITAVLLLALAIATAAAVYLYSQDYSRADQRNRLTSTGNAASFTTEGTTKSFSQGAAEITAKKSAPTTLTESSEKVVPVDPIVTAGRAKQPAIATPVRITDLPYSIQQEIPEMRFSSHIFAEDPTLRLVNINGVNIREGSRVSNDIRLLEITEEGVVLSYLTYTFEMSVLRDWTFD